MTREEQIAQYGLINVYPHMTPEEIARGEANKKASHPWESYPYTPNQFYDPTYPLGYKPGSVPPWYIQAGNHWENPPGETLVGKLGSQFFVTDPRGGGLYSYGIMPNKDVWNSETKKWEPNPDFAPYLGTYNRTIEAGKALRASQTSSVAQPSTANTNQTAAAENYTAFQPLAATTQALAQAYSPFPAYNTMARAPSFTLPLTGPGFTGANQSSTPKRTKQYTFGAIPDWYYGQNRNNL